MGTIRELSAEQQKVKLQTGNCSLPFIITLWVEMVLPDVGCIISKEQENAVSW